MWLSIEGNSKGSVRKRRSYIAAQHIADPAAYQTRLSINEYSSAPPRGRQDRISLMPTREKNRIDDALIADGRFHLHAPSLAGASRGADYLRYASIITHCVAKARAGSVDFVSNAVFRTCRPW
ncbi:hypothetical protein [Paraburkholderia dioscoreae]|uniref:Uncharacterized protein n=1 Tax=Paraburkholderia dioscoreae TaxID=2604047 RepID=A0A5Q4ZDE8_9BURK|nr:hypothetical protein [Paraburkholderia dioscoreae]VVD33379.1 protein of unknown function [Paraburkholderia dioscoreae]